MPIRFVGDIHGDTDYWLRATKNIEYSVQVGDFGFREDWERLGKFTRENHPFYRDPNKVKVLAGNHDAYPVAKLSPYYLGDFGEFEFPNEPKFFFIRGAFSIDKAFILNFSKLPEW